MLRVEAIHVAIAEIIGEDVNDLRVFIRSCNETAVAKMGVRIGFIAG